jgi:flagellar biosynthetic protein FlhB
MAEKPASERTEQPTPRRLEKARKKGQVPESEELASIATLLALVAVMVLAGPGLLQWSITQVTQGLLCETRVFADNKSFLDFIEGKTTDLLLIVCPILIALFAGSALGSIAVSGLNFAPEAISLKFEQLNPVTGFEKLVNARSVIKLLASILKILFVAVVAWSYLRDRLDTLAALRWAWSAQMLTVIAKMIMGLMIRIGIALLVIGIADAFYQKWKYIEELKMTRQEVRQERRDEEGAPEVRTRIRRIQFEMARKRMLQEVPKASVVLVNPTHIAVALRYEARTTEAPILVAKGAGHLAEKIREIARAYGVPIVRRPELARTIYSTVETGNPIPEALYVAVAGILAMIYRLRHRKEVRK